MGGLEDSITITFKQPRPNFSDKNYLLDTQATYAGNNPSDPPRVNIISNGETINYTANITTFSYFTNAESSSTFQGTKTSTVIALTEGGFLTMFDSYFFQEGNMVSLTSIIDGKPSGIFSTYSSLLKKNSVKRSFDGEDLITTYYFTATD